jgi:PleD family two-component response regulator
MRPLTETLGRRVWSAQLEEVVERRMPMIVSEIHILVADDQHNRRGNLKMILEAAGYHVDATSQEVLARCYGWH